MPELPEVQTVVNQLHRKIVGKKIARFHSAWKKKVLTPYATFVRKVANANVRGVRRLGKHIVIDLDNDHSIVIHLKMTGHLLYKTGKNRDARQFIEDPLNGYIHHIFTFHDGTTLEFSDMRKFGWLRLLKTAEVEVLKSIQELGIDALSPRLNATLLQKQMARKKRRSIGEALLDQSLIAGVGNIYRSEALYRAGIMPERRVESLTDEEWRRLLPALKTTLREAVRLRGTTDGDFRDTDGLPGQFQKTLHVYGRGGKPCQKCATIIVRKKLGQRSVFFCFRCQG